MLHSVGLCSYFNGHTTISVLHPKSRLCRTMDTGVNNTFLRDSALYAEVSTCKQKLCTIHDLLFPRLTNKNPPNLVT